MRGVGRTRPAEKAKEKETEENGEDGSKGRLEAKEDNNARERRAMMMRTSGSKWRLTWEEGRGGGSYPQAVADPEQRRQGQHSEEKEGTEQVKQLKG